MRRWRVAGRAKSPLSLSYAPPHRARRVSVKFGNRLRSRVCSQRNVIDLARFADQTNLNGCVSRRCVSTAITMSPMSLTQTDTTTARHRSFRARTRAAGDAAGSFEALVTTYGLPYEIGWGYLEQIQAGAFSAASGKAVPIMAEHVWSAGPIGVGTVVDGKNGIVVQGSLYLADSERARDVLPGHARWLDLLLVDRISRHFPSRPIRASPTSRRSQKATSLRPRSLAWRQPRRRDDGCEVSFAWAPETTDGTLGASTPRGSSASLWRAAVVRGLDAPTWRPVNDHQLPGDRKGPRMQREDGPTNGCKRRDPVRSTPAPAVGVRVGGVVPWIVREAMPAALPERKA